MNSHDLEELLRQAACVMELGPFLISSFAMFAFGLVIGFIVAMAIWRIPKKPKPKLLKPCGDAGGGQTTEDAGRPAKGYAGPFLRCPGCGVLEGEFHQKGCPSLPK